MATSSGFYLTLPSNASMELHPNNTLTYFVTALLQLVSLSGQLECSLVEIQHTHNWYNVRDEDVWPRTHTYVIHVKGRIDVGYYDRPAKLVWAINKTLAEIIVWTVHIQEAMQFIRKL